MGNGRSMLELTFRGLKWLLSNRENFTLKVELGRRMYTEIEDDHQRDGQPSDAYIKLIQEIQNRKKVWQQTRGGWLIVMITKTEKQ